jgi:hypothetical protein
LHQLHAILVCVYWCVLFYLSAYKMRLHFLIFRPKCGAIIQPKSGQTKLWPEKCMTQYWWNLVENVTFETRRVSLLYRLTLIIAHVSLKNVMFEIRRVSLVYHHAHYRSCLTKKCHVWDTPWIAGVSSRSCLKKNVTFEIRCVSLVYHHAHYRSCLTQKCHVWDTPWIAGVSSRSLSLMSQ